MCEVPSLNVIAFNPWPTEGIRISSKVLFPQPPTGQAAEQSGLSATG